MISCDLQAIVMLNDPSVLGTLPAWLKSMGVRPIVHRQAATALQTVTRQRVDAVFMDWDLDRDFSGLQEIRATATGRRLVGMAIISPQAPVRDAFRVSDFILEKPLFQQRVLANASSCARHNGPRPHAIHSLAPGNRSYGF